jgi:hypothetical protein
VLGVPPGWMTMLPLASTCGERAIEIVGRARRCRRRPLRSRRFRSGATARRVASFGDAWWHSLTALSSCLPENSRA